MCDISEPEVFTAMQDRTEFSIRTIAIEDWMIDLLEDDRPAPARSAARLTDLHWMYNAALIRPN